MGDLKKSTRHAKIAGDFAEGLVLYWLSKSGYECVRVDHTGIDLIACTKNGKRRMGISVQGRSRHAGTEKASVNLHPFEAAREACRSFKCVPYSAIVVDGGNVIRCFLLPLDHLERIATGKADGTRYWLMSDKFLKRCCSDRKIRWFELVSTQSQW